MLVDLIIVTILNITYFFKVSNEQFKYNTYNRQVMGRVTFRNYTVTICNFLCVARPKKTGRIQMEQEYSQEQQSHNFHASIVL